MNVFEASYYEVDKIAEEFFNYGHKEEFLFDYEILKVMANLAEFYKLSKKAIQNDIDLHFSVLEAIINEERLLREHPFKNRKEIKVASEMITENIYHIRCMKFLKRLIYSNDILELIEGVD